MTASARSCLTIVLAAGEGTRMRSDIPKVLHKVAGRSLVGHALAGALEAGSDALAVVVGPGREDVAAEVAALAPGAPVFVQTERRGTAHAVLAAREALAGGFDDVLIVYGDTPLVRAETLKRLRAPLARGAGVVVLGFEAGDPTGYGRLISEGSSLVAIREEKDASDAERAIKLSNGGLMAISGAHALALLEGVGNANAKGEFYLTDVVEGAVRSGLAVAVEAAPEAEVQGVNDRAQLATVEAELQRRLRAAALAGGATLIAPETVFFAHDTRLGRDVVVEPNVVFGPGVTVGDGAVIHAFSHLEGAEVGAGVSVGPFARLRPGARLAAKSRVGNFVEVKNARIGEGAKLNHLTYVGDAEVGPRANLGAGTITCNYDGVSKFRTVIGADAFVGSNSTLVAPVTVGEGAYVGAGSVIVEEVPADALAIGRGRQVTKEGRAAKLRAMQKAKKAGA
ncbi:bifunctional UDP-N-acetylglucosamine pyrophosphorylase/glucosamine-1-phosphate N-acetyltransferase [Methylopila capsulata]|uniref:Bifunctional protein GlmU n=1 Tax=Methylopila capsulata TaxID=61654 RepID=A0A9W6IUT5_9HYPH|nr:bifunctional UDP-N-acetylglucosamine diphosphorylase/glucosamine-1-phosphate N-acetyltransferase GlmU [Methylopila capsulata]MBM7850392.1 bifunctional UDP-N-acetylglucosamine pyrophosphorylase/glucosamine-1-phosphate N-acetyltransferase [Methylopila capsulata]GLK55685.1 bifunctional protein GlmU [Methylopila capsulata]